MTDCFLEIVDELSKSQLYGYREADRGSFDFACVLERDRSRALVGQTLTHHAAGIEKDLNMLLLSDEIELPVYLYAGATRNESRIHEVVGRFGRQLPNRAAVLRLFSYPSDFSADNDEDREAVRTILRDKILEDLLMNVVFGRLAGVDIRLFLQSAGIPGLALAALERVAEDGFVNMPHLAKPLGISASTLRPRVQALVTAGMLDTHERGQCYRVTQRARVFLKLCSLLAAGMAVNPELAFVMKRLRLEPMSLADLGPVSFGDAIGTGASPRDALRRLAVEIGYARHRFEANISGGPYGDKSNPPPGSDESMWIGR